MEASAEKRVEVWQPLTFGGVAAFARATTGRLLLIQFVIGLAAGGSAAWCLRHSWFPVIAEGIQKLPAKTEIRSGELQWQTTLPERLAENPFLALSVDLNHEGSIRAPSQFNAEFGLGDLKIISLLGYASLKYPKTFRIGLSRAEAEPWWGAWSPVILALTIGATAIGLILSWAALSVLYAAPAYAAAFFANRKLGVVGCWRLCGAALMPGALVLSCAILFYGLRLLDLVHLVVVFGIHFLIGWVYLIASVRYLPRSVQSDAKIENPFAAPQRQISASANKGVLGKDENP